MHCTLHLASACLNPVPCLKILKNAGANLTLKNTKNLTVEQQALQRIETYSKEIQSDINSIFSPDQSAGCKPEVKNSKNAIVEKWLTQSVEEIDDSESSRDSQTSIYDDLKTLRNENIKVGISKSSQKNHKKIKNNSQKIRKQFKKNPKTILKNLKKLFPEKSIKNLKKKILKNILTKINTKSQKIQKHSQKKSIQNLKKFKKKSK